MVLRRRLLGELLPINITWDWEFSGGPMFWTRLSHLRGSGPTPVWSYKTPQATWHRRKGKIENENEQTHTRKHTHTQTKNNKKKTNKQNPKTNGKSKTKQTKTHKESHTHTLKKETEKTKKKRATKQINEPNNEKKH